MGLGTWGQRWARSELSRDELDPRLLMWDMQRNIETEALPDHRVVVRFRFTDVRGNLPRVTWLILERDDVDVCYRDPGFEVDLVVSGRLRALIGVWLGDSSIPGAIRAGELQVEGPRTLARAFPHWLRRSAFATVERPRAAVDRLTLPVTSRRPSARLRAGSPRRPPGGGSPPGRWPRPSAPRH